MMSPKQQNIVNMVIISKTILIDVPSIANCGHSGQEWLCFTHHTCPVIVSLSCHLVHFKNRPKAQNIFPHTLWIRSPLRKCLCCCWSWQKVFSDFCELLRLMILFAERHGKTNRLGAAKAYWFSGVASQRLCSITFSAFCVSTSAEYRMGWWLDEVSAGPNGIRY